MSALFDISPTWYRAEPCYIFNGTYEEWMAYTFGIRTICISWSANMRECPSLDKSDSESLAMFTSESGEQSKMPTRDTCDCPSLYKFSESLALFTLRISWTIQNPGDRNRCNAWISIQSSTRRRLLASWYSQCSCIQVRNISWTPWTALGLKCRTNDVCCWTFQGAAKVINDV